LAETPPFAPIPKFDFSEFCGDSSKRLVEFIGLTETETNTLLSQKHGIAKVLMDKYPDHTKKAGAPLAPTKCLIVFEEYGRDTTYREIAAACDISVDTAATHMAKVRKWASQALKLKIEHSGERVYLVSNDSLSAKAERLDGHLQKMERVMESLVSDVNSIRQSGQVPVLNGKAAAMISGYEQVKQLEEAQPAI
jgi:hypothetical protein